MDLDNTKSYSKVDKKNMLKFPFTYPDQITQSRTLVAESDIPRLYDIDHIIINGMNEGRIAGELLNWYLREKIALPVSINKGIALPKWINKHTLVLTLNYSGECYETLSNFKQAYQKHCKIIGISSNGHLKEYCDHRHVSHVDLIPEYPSRFTIGFLFFSSLFSLLRTGLLQINIKQDVIETQEVLDRQIKKLHSSIPKKQNTAKQIACRIYKTIPIMYGWDQFTPIAKHWTSQFNQNSKLLSYSTFVLESMHHTIEGLANQQQFTKDFSSIIFRDHHLETKEMKIRLDFLKDLCDDVTAHTILVHSEGKSLLANLFNLIFLGDMISIYTALKSDINPELMPVNKQFNDAFYRL